MPWFKVDDTLHSHPKARRAGVAAMGLWSLAGAYSAAYKLDGLVPSDYVRTWPGGPRLADRLVASGLWDEVDDGWRFHDWCDYQMTAEEIERDRDLARNRQKRRRDKLRELRDKEANHE